MLTYKILVKFKPFIPLKLRLEYAFMRPHIILIILFTLFFKNSFAQDAKLTVHFANTTAKNYSLMDWKLILRHNYLNLGEKTFKLNDKKNTDTQIIRLKNPQFFFLYCNEENKNFNYDLYIRPGDNINLTVDFSKPDFDIKITGKGSENNQPILAETPYFSTRKLYGDTLPTRILSLLKEYENKRNKSLETYLTKYKPSKDFIENWKLNQRYFVPNEYFSFKENNKFQIVKSYNRTEPEWRHVQDSLFKAESLQNDNALLSSNYQRLLGSFLSREKERLRKLSYLDSVAFFKDWYNTDAAKGKIEFRDDMTNLLSEKIINRYFKNKSAEYLYAVLLEEALTESGHKNIVEIFQRFKNRFPNSVYIAPFNPYIDTIIEKQKRPITDKMIFAEKNGININTFEEILALNKGKTILLDMWGTWCGPCREEIEKNGSAIKDYFKEKRLNYLYIANYDQLNEKTWKTLIPYFNMEGLHVLANQKLTEDIMSKVKGTGYPTYIIIKKDGTFELSKAGYPMQRDVLIKQLDDALSMK